MSISKRLITPALMIALAVIMAAIYLLNTPQQATGHDGSNHDGTEHDRGQHHSHQNNHSWWRAGSRCVSQTHIDRKHSTVIGHHQAFSSIGYTAGPAKGTLPAKNLSMSKAHIEDEWEVRLSWRASGYKASNNTWACQPYQYQAQRKIGNGSWERWNTSHPNSSRYSETRSQRKRGNYPNSDRSLYKHPTTGTPETVQFRVCNKAKDGTIGACTSPISTQLGGNPWHPDITASVTNKPIWEDTSTIQVAITTNPVPPDGATDATIRVSFNVDKEDDNFEVVTNHNVSISAAGTGSLSVSNPFTRTGTDFTEDQSEQMKVRLSSGSGSNDTDQITLQVLDDDPIPLTVDFPDDNPAVYAVDGPNTAPAQLNPSGSNSFARRFTIAFTSPKNIPTNDMGATRCPKLAGDWQATFNSSNTSVVNSQAMFFGCTKSSEATVRSAGTFTITPAAVLTHGSQGWTRPVTLSGDSSFSGTVHASNDAFPSKLGVGFAASRSSTEEGMQLTLTINGYDYQNQHNPASCDPSATKYNASVEVIDANSQMVDSVKTVQLSRHCSADATFNVPHGTSGTLTASFSSTGSKVEQRGGYAVHFVTIRPDSTNLQTNRQSITINEGSSGTFSVRLTAQPASDVTLDPACGFRGINESCSASTDPLTFTTSNWSSYQSITIDVGHDGHYSDRNASYTWSAESADPNYHGEKFTIALTQVNDDDGPPLFFPTGMTTSLSRDDKVTLRIKLPSYDPAEDICRIDYVQTWTYRENLVSDDEHEHPHANEVQDYYFIPLADEYTAGVYEHVGAYQDGTEYMKVRHYEDGRNSDLEIYDYTPSQSKNGRIKLYTIASTTKCKGRVTQWTVQPKPTDYAGCTEFGDSWRQCRWVNYSVD